MQTFKLGLSEGLNKNQPQLADTDGDQTVLGRKGADRARGQERERKKKNKGKEVKCLADHPIGGARLALPRLAHA